MIVDLTLSRSALQEISAALRRDPDRAIRCIAGVGRRVGVSEFLVHRIGLHPLGRGECSAAVVVCGAAQSHEIPRILGETVLDQGGHLDTTAVAIGIGSAGGYLAGLFVNRDGGVEPVRRIKIVCAGLPSIAPQADESWQAEPIVAEDARESTWSRTIGALGIETWRRLTALRVAVVGCGRTGSLVVSALSRLGVRQITLVDPDFVEKHNLGEMDGVELGDVGLHKIVAVAQNAKSYNLSAMPSFTLVKQSVMAVTAVAALKDCDMLVSCVDNAMARFAGDYVAKLYLKPLLDIGTGVLLAEDEMAMGADVRLLLPEQCLMCFGGIAGATQALGELTTSGTPDAAREIAPDWRAQRAGSLRSLNTAAVGLATRLLEDFISGRVQSSTWLRLEYETNGIPRVHQGAGSVTRSCSICAVAGLGDAGLSWLRAVVQEWLRRNHDPYDGSR